MQIESRKRRVPGDADKQRKGAAFFWSVQVDAVARLVLLVKVDGGGMARRAIVGARKTKKREGRG